MTTTATMTTTTTTRTKPHGGRVCNEHARRLSRLTAILIGAMLIAGCSSTYPKRNPVGEMFPSVTGKSLEKQTVALPESLSGRPAIILIGYRQNTQFDIDRWFMGLLQTDAWQHATIIEVPTIPGLLPSLVSGWIDDGMRSGIPTEDWGAVVTLYGGAARPVAQFTGTEQGRNTRVVVLDAQGAVIWFDDRGFSARKALEVSRLVSPAG